MTMGESREPICAKEFIKPVAVPTESLGNCLMIVTNTLMLIALRKMFESDSHAKATGMDVALNISQINTADTAAPMAIRYFSRPLKKRSKSQPQVKKEINPRVGGSIDHAPMEIMLIPFTLTQ